MSSRIPTKRLLPNVPPLDTHENSLASSIALPTESEQSNRRGPHTSHQKQKRVACKACRQAKVRYRRFCEAILPCKNLTANEIFFTLVEVRLGASS